MIKVDSEWKNRFFRHMRHWSWMFNINKFNAASMVITDEFFLRELRQRYPSGLNCKLATTSGWQQVIDGDIKKVLVFTAVGELAIVKQLRTLYPDKTVVSGTYDFALAGPDRLARFSSYQRQTTDLARPTILLSAAYSDAEFLAKAIAENGGPLFHEHLSRLFISWLRVHRPFQVSRFYQLAQARFGTGKGFFTHLQVDVLEALFENTAFTLDKFIKFMEQQNARVIVFSQENDVEQAARATLFDNSIERSVWTVKAAKKRLGESLGRRSAEFFGNLSRGRKNASILSAVEASSVQTFSLTLESFLQDQASQMSKLQEFLEINPEAKPRTLDYEDCKQRMPNFAGDVSVMKHVLIDRIGLNVSTFNVG